MTQSLMGWLVIATAIVAANPGLRNWLLSLPGKAVAAVQSGPTPAVATAGSTSDLVASWESFREQCVASGRTKAAAALCGVYQLLSPDADESGTAK